MSADRVVVALRDLARTLPENARLPSVRELMREHAASPVTVQRAIAQLSAEGLVVPRPGAGTFVAPAAVAPGGGEPDLGWQEVALGGPRLGSEETAGLVDLLALTPEGSLSLSTGYLDPPLQPAAALASALARAGRRPGAWGRTPVEGLDVLRDWFAAEISPRHAGHDVVICPGGQAALITAVRALAPPAGVVLVESPTYRGALAAVAAAGLRALPVPSDAEGIRPDHLAQALHRTGARVVYLQPLYANPHGATLAADRRAEVLGIAARAGAFLIEDDWARGLTIDGPAPAPLAADDVDGHVVYVRSLSKTASPGLRVAAVAARGPAGARLRAARVVEDLFVSAPLQHAALDLVSSPVWRRHLKALGTGLRERRDALVAAVRQHLGPEALDLVPAGGLHLWVRLPDGTDEAALVAAAARDGVVVSAGRPSFAAEPVGPHLRLTFGGAPPDVLTEGVRRLARLL
ncbi:MAG: PLP-dependent aminotransferase family protein [Solirubrobacteraceae bacterium]